MIRIGRFTCISVVSLLAPAISPIPLTAGDSLKTVHKYSAPNFASPLNVQCDLNRASCRKWLSLAKKRLTVQFLTQSSADNPNSVFSPDFHSGVPLNRSYRLSRCNNRYDMDRLRRWYMLPPYILRTYSPLYIRCYLRSSFSRYARYNLGWYRGRNGLTSYNLQTFSQPYTRGYFYPSYRLDSNYNFIRYRDRMKLVPSYHQARRLRSFQHLKRGSRVNSGFGSRRSSRSLGRARGGFGSSVGGFRR